MLSVEAPTPLPSSWQIPSCLSSHLWGTYLTVSSLSCLFLVDRVLEKRFGIGHLARGWASGGASAGRSVDEPASLPCGEDEGAGSAVSCWHCRNPCQSAEPTHLQGLPLGVLNPSSWRAPEPSFSGRGGQPLRPAVPRYFPGPSSCFPSL